MNKPPTGAMIVHEVECALARSLDRDVSALSQSSRVIDFLDTQCHKIEQGQWTPESFYVDRMKLSWTKEWRNSSEPTRTQVSECFSNLGIRLSHAEQMRSIWGQIQQVGEHLNIDRVISGAARFASRVTGRRDRVVQINTSATQKMRR